MPKISLASLFMTDSSICTRTKWIAHSLAYSVPIIIFQDTLYILQIIKQCFNIFFHLISSTLWWFAFCNDIL